MPTAAKKAWITAEAAAGVPEIEVGSFVPAKILPQLADTAEVVAHALTIDGLTVAVLVPNFKGAENAVKASVHKLTIPLSVSETHSLRNVNRTHAQMIEEVRRIADLIKTLEAFFACHGNLSQTAEMLIVHRNTLLYRMNRINEIAQIDLNRPETRLALQLAIKANRLLNTRSD